MQAFVAELTATRKAMAQLRESVLKNPDLLGTALGPNIWLLSDAPMGGPDKPAKTAINLNTAERDELLKLPGIDDASATRLLESRHGAGPFLALDDFATRGKLSAETRGKLAALLAAIKTAGVYSRD